MNKEKIKKTNEENTKQKIKAIYPHIVVTGTIDKPCYNIHWYDIEQKTMICGFGSYKLEFVRKWLEEEFVVVEKDIDGLLNRQCVKINNLNNKLHSNQRELNRVNNELHSKVEYIHELLEIIKNDKKEIKRYEDLKKAENILDFFEQNAFKRSIYNTIDTIKQLENEIEELQKMVGK